MLPFGRARDDGETNRNQLVNGSSSLGLRDRAGAFGAERFPSGQREQTVNLPAYAFGGSNPPLSTSDAGSSGARVGGNSSVGRARAFQARGRGFESRFPLQSNLGLSACRTQVIGESTSIGPM